ncbi:MAG: GGDEF domain-containing protein [Acidobacteriota bacterium]|nr:GGDEF domain-containing protein [Acidobacteriota bacterium]
MEPRQNSTDYSAHGDVIAELTAMSLRGLAPTVVLGAIGMTGGAAIIAHHYRDPVIGTIAAVIGVLGIIRVGMVLRMERSAAYLQHFLGCKPLRRFFNGVLLCYFGSLAAVTWWSFHLHRQPAEMVCSIGIFIFCSGISGRIGANPRTAKLHGLVMLFVLGFCLWNPHDELSWTVEAMLTMFAFAHCHAVQEKYDIVVEQIRAQRKLRLLSERDPLTGLVNRRGFEAALEVLCNEGLKFAVLFIDLDGFKVVNDRYGHAVGDEVLRLVGERLVSIVRAKDIVARLGGDEFAILQLPITERRNAETVAERVTYVLGRPFDACQERVTIGASVGISIPLPGQTDSALLLKRADDALYQAKQTGRGRFVYAETCAAPQEDLIAVR